MKAVRIHGARDLRTDQIAQPVPGAGEVLIRVRATGICGTDVEIHDGTMAYFTRGMASYPITPGHEWVGDVVSLGQGVSGFDAGDRVVGECSVGCMSCEICKSGAYHRCPDRTETGILNRDGGFAEYLVFPALFLHKLSPEVDVRAAALVEPTAVALNGVMTAKVTPTDFLAIHGDGPIGLLILMVARVYGAAKIAVVGATPDRLALARELGADAVIDANREDVAARLTEEGPPDVSIEATGIPQAAAAAMQSTRPGGRVVLLGLFAGRLLNGFDLDQIVISDLTVRGAVGSPNIWPDTIRLIESGQVDPLKIVTHSVPLDAFREGLELVTTRAGIKVVVEQANR